MGIARRQGEILGQDIFEVGLCLFPRAGDRPFVVLRRGQHVRAGEKEHRGKAEERKVNAEVAAVAPGNDAVDQCRSACDYDRQRHPPVGGIRVLVDALGLGRRGELCRQLRVTGEEFLRLLQLFFRALRRGRERIQVASCFLFRLGLHAPLAAFAERRDLGVRGSDAGEHLVHIFLPLEGALLFLPVVILHHKVRDRAKNALSREAALAHRHALENAAHRRKRNIVMPVDQKIIQIQRLFPHAAGAKALAGLFVRGENFLRNARLAKAHRCKNHKAPPKFEKAVGEHSPTALRMVYLCRVS